MVHGATASRGASSSDIDANGVVYRNYPPYGYRFQPLLSFAGLNAAVSNTHQVILNAQLQSLISIESYAIAKSAVARRVASHMDFATRTVLP